jgi:hypothetical protein
VTEKSDDKLQRRMQSGVLLLAGLLGAGAGALTGDPYAAATTGWISNEVLSRIGAEVAARVGEAGASRVGATAMLIEADKLRREEQGEEQRSDGFFDPRGAVRPEAHDLLESILLSAANSFEERKLPYLARIYDSTAFDQSVRASDALFLGRVADQLTFHQLQALAVFARHGTGNTELELELAQIEADHRSFERSADPAAIAEVIDLGNRGLVGAWLGDGKVRNPSDAWGGDWDGVSIGQVALSDTGRLLHRLMRLGEMPESDWRAWISNYSGHPRPTVAS